LFFIVGGGEEFVKAGPKYWIGAQVPQKDPFGGASGLKS
jgi:hypothetical protein